MDNSITIDTTNSQAVSVTNKCTCDHGGYCSWDNVYHPSFKCEPCVTEWQADNPLGELRGYGEEALGYIGNKYRIHYAFSMPQPGCSFIYSDAIDKLFPIEDLPF